MHTGYYKLIMLFPHVAKKIEINEKINASSILEQMGCQPDKLMDVSLGNRHMLQMVFDIAKLARRLGRDPQEVIKRQNRRDTGARISLGNLSIDGASVIGTDGPSILGRASAK